MATWPAPARCGLAPVRSAARVGEHIGRDVEVGPLHARCRERIEVRGLDLGSVAGEVTEPEVVAQHDHDVRRVGAWRWSRRPPPVGTGERAADATTEPVVRAGRSCVVVSLHGGRPYRNGHRIGSSAPRRRTTDPHRPPIWDPGRAMPRLLPPSTSRDVDRIVIGRTIRGFVDGFVSVLLAQYLIGLGFSPVEVGAIVTGTLIGSALLTLAFGLTSHRFTLRTLLLAATGMMLVTGLGFASLTWFWPLFVVAVVGTLNPSAGDVSVFLPTEQALVTGHVDAPNRPRLFAVYNLAGIFAGAVGALVSVAPEALAHAMDWDVTSTQRASFLLYASAARRDLPRLPRLAPGARPSGTCAGVGTSRRAAVISADGARARRLVQPRLRRERVRRHVAPRAVAAPPLRPLRGPDRCGVLRRGAARRVLAAPRATGGPTVRADPYHGLHPHPRQHPARARRVRAVGRGRRSRSC